MMEAVGLWLGTRLQYLSSVVLGGAALLCVVLSDVSSSEGDGPKRAAVAGLALTFAPMLTLSFS